MAGRVELNFDVLINRKASSMSSRVVSIIINVNSVSYLCNVNFPLCTFNQRVPAGLGSLERAVHTVAVTCLHVGAFGSSG